MKKDVSKIVMIFVIAFFAVSVRAQTKTEHLFYYVNNEQCFEALVKNIDKISIVAPGAFSVDEDGIVWGSVDPRVIELGRAQNVGVMPLIVNPGFDQLMLHRLLVNPQARSRCISTLTDLCVQHKFLGIQFDFENLNMNDRDAFTKFYQETAEAMHAKGFKLSIAVVHRPEEYAGPTAYHKWLFENWRAGYDLAALAKAADFISVMSYSQHTRRTTPGPSAGLPWVRQIVEYFLKFMPPEKLSLGIPLGSMHWYTALDTVRYFANARSWSDAIDYARAVGILNSHKARIQWNDEQKVSFAVFDNAGLFEYIYLEDAQSFKAKYELLKQFKLRGFSAWVLGNEDQAMWNILSNVTR
jgi:spore germination protein YaaH